MSKVVMEWSECYFMYSTSSLESKENEKSSLQQKEEQHLFGIFLLKLGFHRCCCLRFSHITGSFSNNNAVSFTNMATQQK